MNATVLLINTNREVDPWPVMPLGLCYLATNLEKEGYHVSILDLALVADPFEKIQRTLNSQQFDAIGLSIRNIDNVNFCAPHFYLDQVRQFVVSVSQKAFETPLIIGGSAVGICPEAIMDFLGVDYAVAGDGEKAMLQWLSHVIEHKNGHHDSSDPRLYFYRKDDGTIVSPTASCLLDLTTELDFPKPYRWLDVQKYQAQSATITVQTKRGCAFRCLYCSYNLIEGTHFRLRDPKHIVEELKEWFAYTSPGTIEFVDSTFNAPQRFAIDICEHIIDAGLTHHYTTMGVNPGPVSDELVTAMKAAGFTSLMCSPDSASDTILNNLRKNFNRDELVKAATIFRKHNMRVFWFFILGGPGETRETLAETLTFCKENVPREDVIHFTIAFRVFPGTALAEHLIRQKQIPQDTDLLHPYFYCEPALSPAEILKEIHGETKWHPNIITYFDMEIYNTIKRLNLKFFPRKQMEHSWTNVPRLNWLLGKLGIWQMLHWRHRRKLGTLVAQRQMRGIYGDSKQTLGIQH